MLPNHNATKLPTSKLSGNYRQQQTRVTGYLDRDEFLDRDVWMMQLEPAVNCQSRRVDRTLFTRSDCFVWLVLPSDKGVFRPLPAELVCQCRLMENKLASFAKKSL